MCAALADRVVLGFSDIALAGSRALWSLGSSDGGVEGAVQECDFEAQVQGEDVKQVFGVPSTASTQSDLLFHVSSFAGGDGKPSVSRACCDSAVTAAHAPR